MGDWGDPNSLKVSMRSANRQVGAEKIGVSKSEVQTILFISEVKKISNVPYW